LKNPQFKLNFSSAKSDLSFGGELLKDKKNRTARPLSSRDPLHIVLKSSLAKGEFSLGKHNAECVLDIVRKHCAKYGVKLYRFSNNYTHLHLLVKIGSRLVYQRFIRSLTASIAMAVTGAKKMKDLKSILGKKTFFDCRPFTRVVKSFKAFQTMIHYIILNQLEALGLIPKREGRLKDLTSLEWELIFRCQRHGVG
jgi:putative transposase